MKRIIFFIINIIISFTSHVYAIRASPSCHNVLLGDALLIFSPVKRLIILCFYKMPLRELAQNLFLFNNPVVELLFFARIIHRDLDDFASVALVRNRIVLAVDLRHRFLCGLVHLELKDVNR